jgi:Mitochondrial ribosomal subunit S27
MGIVRQASCQSGWRCRPVTAQTLFENYDLDWPSHFELLNSPDFSLGHPLNLEASDTSQSSISPRSIPLRSSEGRMPTKIPTYAPSWHRLVTLNKERSIIWNQFHNPTGLRMGNKILRMKLTANAVKDYYPPKIRPTPRLMSRLFPGFSYDDETRNHKEEMIEAYNFHFSWEGQ